MVSSIRISTKVRSVAIALAAAAMTMASLASSVSALDTTSLTLSDPRPSETGLTYTFDSDGWDTSTTINCIVMDFDQAADGGSGVPTGMDTTGGALSASSTAVTEASWTKDFATNGTVTLTNGGEAIQATPGDIILTGIDNPTSEVTSYLIVTTYTDGSCTGGNEVDTATIAWATKDGELVTLTIDPTLTFTCAGVGSSQFLDNPGSAGSQTNIDTSSVGLDFSAVATSSTNGIGAHDITVTTNATGGYVVYVRTTGDLQNQASDTITTHTGTNGSPTAFAAAGTEAWGYHTEDNTLTGGTANRFGTGATEVWAGHTTSDEEIMDNTGPASDTVRVGHQVGLSALTEAGTYNTTVIYSVVATY